MSVNPGTHSLLTAREWRGVWWHPSAPQDVVSGTLSFTPGEGLRLSVIGVVEDLSQWWSLKGLFAHGDEDRTYWGVLHGIDDGERDITLCDVHLMRSKGQQVVCQDLVVGRALVGCHLGNAAEAAFDRVTAAVEGLSAFVGQSEASDQEVEFELDECLDARLWVMRRFEGQHSLAGRSDMNVAETVLSAESKHPTAADELISLATTLEALVSLVHQYPMRIHMLRLQLAQEGRQGEARNGRKTVDVYQDASAAEVRNRRRPRLLCKCDSVPPETLIPRWFAVMKLYRGAVQMLLTLLYEEGEFINPRVVTAVTAAEAMQSALVTNAVLSQVTALPEDEYRALVEAAIAAVPTDAEEAIRRLFRHNVAGLTARLAVLATGDDGEPLAGLLPDPEAWAKASAKARDSIAHGSVSGVAGVDRLHAVVETSKAVVTLRLLERLGLSQDDLREVVTASKDLHWVRQLAAEQFPSGDSR